MLEHFTLATFADHVQDSFRLYPEASGTRSESPTFELVLIEATDLSRPGQSRASGPHHRAPFSLVFRGPGTPVLPQRIYRMAHAEVGEFELFLVPIGPDEQGLRYEAVFT